MASAAMATLICTNPIAKEIGGHSWIPNSRKLLQPFPTSYQIRHSGGKNRRRVLLPFRVIEAQSSSSSSSAQSQTSVDTTGGQTERARKSLQDLAETLVLPQGFLSKLPNDLKVDLNDAAFALSSGPINQDCGEKVGELVMGLARAWEQADTQAAAALANEVPSLQDILPSDPVSSAALGKRLEAAGRYLASTGQYGNGELQKMSKALVAAGEALSVGSPSLADKAPKIDGARILKFGDLQVEITSQNAYIGAVVAFGFGALCWGLTSAFQNNPINESQYANDSSFAFASSLRGTLLTAGYGCTALSAIVMAGLLTLASQVGPKDTS